MPLPRAAVEATVATEPELRFSPSGVAVCSLRLVATDRRFNRESNEWEDGDKLWIDATCFKQLAENVAEHIQKGSRVLVFGKFRTEEWTDRESGAKRSKISFICDSVAKDLKFVGERTAQRTSTDSPQPDAWSSPAPDSNDPPF